MHNFILVGFVPQFQAGLGKFSCLLLSDGSEPFSELNRGRKTRRKAEKDVREGHTGRGTQGGAHRKPLPLTSQTFETLYHFKGGWEQTEGRSCAHLMEDESLQDTVGFGEGTP